MKLTIGKKLGFGFGIVIALILISAAIAMFNMNRMDLAINETVDEAYPTEVACERLTDGLHQSVGALRGYLLLGDDGQQARLFAEARAEAWTQVDQSIEQLTGYSAEWSNVEDKQLLAAIQSDAKQLRRHQDDIESLAQGEDSKQAHDVLEAMAAPLVRKIRDGMDEISASAQQRVQRNREALAQANTAMTTSLIGATAVAIVLAMVIAVVLSRRIVNAVQTLVDRARAVAEGDLTGEKIVVPVNDEIGELADTFNTMTAGLRDLASQIGGVSGNIDSASSQILAASKQQVAGTREQAATVQQVSSTMKELTESGRQISDKANDVASSAEATSDATTSGQQAAQNTNQTMDSIRQQVEQVAENIVALSEKTQTIGEIIATVNDIAEQSNLLALNASIESVSAGEQGSRFTVVANEMKNLADQAKESTVQVRNILSDIQKGINTSVMLTEEAVKRVESGKEQADATEQTIREMSATTSRSIEAFQQIAGGASQQQVGFDQVTQGMTDISTAAEQTAASTNQLESAASNLSALSQQLQSAVGRYRI